MEIKGAFCTTHGDNIGYDHCPKCPKTIPIYRDELLMVSMTLAAHNRSSINNMEDVNNLAIIQAIDLIKRVNKRYENNHLQK